jgi:bifunctional non-homologous end joining protein LigD
MTDTLCSETRTRQDVTCSTSSSSAGNAWQTPPAFLGTGAQAVQLSKDQQLEGVLAKRTTSTYQPGRRSPDWIKIKNVRAQEVVIGGWKPGAGRRAGTIGSLLLGIPTKDGLEYAGKVGTGFTPDRLKLLEGSSLASLV